MLVLQMIINTVCLWSSSRLLPFQIEYNLWQPRLEKTWEIQLRQPIANHLLSIARAMVLISEEWRLCLGLTPPFVHQWGFPQSFTQEGIVRPVKPGKNTKDIIFESFADIQWVLQNLHIGGASKSCRKLNGALRLILKLPFRANTMPLLRCNVYADQLKEQVKRMW